ncbi:MAG: RNA polymerase alpha subunit C-terminal domain-containing protein [Chitinophagales bacterium]
MPKGTLRVCEKGHKYYKSSDCPTCPTCELKRKPANGFLSIVSSPARRALENAQITTLSDLSKHSEKEILKMHGIGKKSIPKLREALEKDNLNFAED